MISRISTVSNKMQKAVNLTVKRVQSDVRDDRKRHLTLSVELHLRDERTNERTPTDGQRDKSILRGGEENEAQCLIEIKGGG